MDWLEICSCTFIIIILTVMSYFDIRELQIPLWCLVVLGAGVVFFVCFSLITGEKETGQILMGCIPGIIILFLAWCGNQVGFGDGLVLICLGLISGWRQSMIILLCGLCLASAYSLGLLCTRRAGRDSRLAFIPFLEGGYLACRIFLG